jgi:hypothetical protein
MNAQHETFMKRPFIILVKKRWVITGQRINASSPVNEYECRRLYQGAVPSTEKRSSHGGAINLTHIRTRGIHSSLE